MAVFQTAGEPPSTGEQRLRRKGLDGEEQHRPQEPGARKQHEQAAHGTLPSSGGRLSGFGDDVKGGSISAPAFFLTISGLLPAGRVGRLQSCRVGRFQPGRSGGSCRAVQADSGSAALANRGSI